MVPCGSWPIHWLVRPEVGRFEALKDQKVPKKYAQLNSCSSAEIHRQNLLSKTNYKTKTNKVLRITSHDISFCTDLIRQTVKYFYCKYILLAIAIKFGSVCTITYTTSLIVNTNSSFFIEI